MAWYPKQLTRAQLAERRQEGFELLKRKRLSQRAIAEKLRVSEAAVSQWQKVLSEEGMKGAKAKRASGSSCQTRSRGTGTTVGNPETRRKAGRLCE